MPTQTQFGKLYQNVLKDHRLEHVDIRILGFLLSYAPSWRFIQTFVAKELNLSLSTVARSVTRLDAAGYLTFDTKVRKSGVLRKNIRVQHQPSHWNPIEDEQSSTGARGVRKSKKQQASVAQAIQTMSPLNGVHVTDDIPIVSRVTYDVEATESSYEDLDTESYDAEAASECGKALASPHEKKLSRDELWRQVNVPLCNYIEIDPSQIDPADIPLIHKQVEDALSMRQGLKLQDNELGEFATTGRYWRDFAQQTISDNNSATSLKPMYCVQIVGEEYRLFKRPEASSSATQSKML